MSNVVELLKARQATYGPPEENFANCAMLWSAWLRPIAGCDLSLSAADVAVMMLLMKVARLMPRTWDEDTALDIEGYAACLNQILNIGE